MLFFAFEHGETPDHVLKPVLIALPPMQTGRGDRIYHLKGHDPESTRYYGSTDEVLMENLRQALIERGLAFREVPEEELPERERRELDIARRYS
ncbi:MAG TPA: hypothetical protein VFH06_00870 [Candidatus Saccharimonadales bacterium]|nr:hypothetical protein [Candidatus Saccharimonadales bacterium]